MAVAKKAAKKAPVKRSAPRVELPPGYETIAGSFGGQQWDVEKMPNLEGIVDKNKDDLTVGSGRNKKTQSLVEVKTDSGTYTVWKSAALYAFFDEVEEGDSVCLIYQGLRKIAGQKNPMKDIIAGIKPKRGKTHN